MVLRYLGRAPDVRPRAGALWLVVGVAVWNGFFDLYVSRGAREYGRSGRSRSRARAARRWPTSWRRDARRHRRRVDLGGRRHRAACDDRARSARRDVRRHRRIEATMHPLIYDWNPSAARPPAGACSTTRRCATGCSRRRCARRRSTRRSASCTSSTRSASTRPTSACPAPDRTSSRDVERLAREIVGRAAARRAPTARRAR